jgi:hypothetical protein
MFLFALLVEVALYQPKQSVSKILFQRPKAYVAEPLPFFSFQKLLQVPKVLAVGLQAYSSLSE